MDKDKRDRLYKLLCEFNALQADTKKASEALERWNALFSQELAELQEEYEAERE